MIKKLQRRFILAAVSAFGVVMLILLISVNLVNYFKVTDNVDQIIDRLMEFENTSGPPMSGDFPYMEDLPGMGPEAKHTTRFFAVRVEKNAIEIISKDYTVIDEETAIAYAFEIEKKGSSRGYYKGYRYRCQDGLFIFLNVEANQLAMKNLLLITALTGIISMAIITLIIVFISKYAITPFARNIERQKQFITDASHELKTPITSVSTSADILAMENEENEWIKNIQKQSVRMGKLVEDLVALSRFDEQLPANDKVKFEMSEIVWEISDSFELMAKSKSINYTTKIDEGVVINASKTDIQKLLSILLDNAVKYTPQNGIIEFTVRKSRRHMVIEVYNSSEPFDRRKISKIFDRFYRMDESHSSKVGGNGIGLSMAESIVEKYSGTIKASSKDGKSMLIRIEL